MFSFTKKLPSLNPTGNKTALKKSTQAYLAVAEVRDDVAILKDGNLRGIIAVSALNFALKSEDEQQAIILNYQGFLNALEFPIQILVQSRPFDVAPYINFLKGRAEEISNELLQMQIAEYTEFIYSLVDAGRIMNKAFYVVVPYNINQVKDTAFSRFKKALNPGSSIVLNLSTFRQNKQKLRERMNTVHSGLASLGLEVAELKTAEIIELLYTCYNMDSSSSLHAEALNRLQVEKLSNDEQNNNQK